VSARGFRAFGTRLVRIDLVERIARATHDMRSARAPFIPDPTLAVSFGIDAATLGLILVTLGFRDAGDGQWTWGSRPRQRAERRPPRPGAFSALENWPIG
jgi:ATP-dependent RNA helicase SUPV3L1/SUV3